MDSSSDELSDREKWTVEQHMKLLRGEVDQPDVKDGRALDLPAWFDIEKFQRGQQYFKNNYYALFVSKLCGLVAILTVPEISSVLVMTQQSSEPKTAFKRYLETIGHMLLWYDGDVVSDSSWAKKSLKAVHNKHVSANERGKKQRKGYVSQASLALTQFGFMGYGLLFPKQLGLHITSEKDIEGFIHFWRTIGYMIGIQDRYNICRDSVSETKELCGAILNQMFVPSIKKPDQNFKDLSVALLDAMWAAVQIINVESFMTYLKYISGIEVQKCSTCYTRFLYNFQIFVHETLLSSEWFGGMWRAIFNFQMWLNIYLVTRFPLVAHFSLGIPLTSLQFYRKMQDLTINLRLFVMAITMASLSISCQLILGLAALTSSMDILTFVRATLIPILQIMSAVLYMYVLFTSVRAVFDGNKQENLVDAARLWLFILFINNILIIFVCTLLGLFLSFHSMAEDLKLLLNHYSVNLDDKQLLDEIQMRFYCCGGSDISNWFYKDWQNIDVEPNHVVDSQTTGWDAVPFSCCSRLVAPPCIHEKLKGFGLGSVYNQGCATALAQGVGIYVGVCLFIALLSLLPIGCLLLNIRRKKLITEIDTNFQEYKPSLYGKMQHMMLLGNSDFSKQRGKNKRKYSKRSPTKKSKTIKDPRLDLKELLNEAKRISGRHSSFEDMEVSSSSDDSFFHNARGLRRSTSESVLANI